MNATTRYLSRLSGLCCLLAAAAMLVNRGTMVALVTALLHDAPLLFTIGLFTSFAGLAMVLAHNRWSGGATVIVVTLVGWVVLAKGLTLLLLPTHQVSELALVTLRYANLYECYAAISLLLGLYLTYQGFRGLPAARHPVP